MMRILPPNLSEFMYLLTNPPARKQLDEREWGRGRVNCESLVSESAPKWSKKLMLSEVELIQGPSARETFPSDYSRAGWMSHLVATLFWRPNLERASKAYIKIIHQDLHYISLYIIITSLLPES